MEITWYGHSCFRLMERSVASVAADPFDESIGYGRLSLPATDVVTISHQADGHNFVEGVKKFDFVLERPGEYEIKNVFITGVETWNPDLPPDELRRNIMFVYDFNGTVVAHLGDLDHVPTQAQVEQMGEIDVLLVPVGGGNALNASQASEVISLIEPLVVVPMHYQTGRCAIDLDPLEKFLKEMGVSEVNEQDSLRVTRSGLGEDTQIVVLKVTE